MWKSYSLYVMLIYAILVTGGRLTTLIVILFFGETLPGFNEGHSEATLD